MPRRGGAAVARHAWPDPDAWQAPTGHWVVGRFLPSYRGAAEPVVVFGPPLTAGYTDTDPASPTFGRNVQWFERARFARRPDGDVVSLGRVGAEALAARVGA